MPGHSKMKTCNSSGHLRAIFANLVLSVMFALPCVASAQDEVTLTYHKAEDPGERLISSRNIELALAFAFNSVRFWELWPRYGYPYSEFLSSCDSKNLKRYDIGSGALAIPSTDDGSEEYFGLPLAGSTRPEDVAKFIANNKASNAGGVQEGEGERKAVRMREICRILPRPDPSSTDDPYTRIVVVTQRPIPGSSADLRLTELE